MVPLERCEHDIKHRVDIAVQVLDNGVYIHSQLHILQSSDVDQFCDGLVSVGILKNLLSVTVSVSEKLCKKQLLL